LQKTNQTFGQYAFNYDVLIQKNINKFILGTKLALGLFDYMKEKLIILKL